MKHFNLLSFLILSASVLLMSCLSDDDHAGSSIATGNTKISFESANDDLDVRIINVDSIPGYEPLGGDTSLVTLILEDGKDTLELELNERYKLFLRDRDSEEGAVVTFFLHPDSIEGLAFIEKTEANSYILDLDLLKLEEYYTLVHQLRITIPIIYHDREELPKSEFLEKYGVPVDDVTSLWSTSINIEKVAHLMSTMVEFPHFDVNQIQNELLETTITIEQTGLILSEDMKIEYQCEGIDCEIDPEVIEFNVGDHNQNVITLDTVKITVK